MMGRAAPQAAHFGGGGAVEDATNSLSIIVRDRIWGHPARERARPGIGVGLLFGPVGLP